MADAPLDRPEDTFFVESLFGGQTRLPLVKMTMKGQSITITADEARQVAYNILDGCAAADYDAVTYRVGMRVLGLGLRETQKMMTQMRAARAEMVAEKAKKDGT